MIRITTLLLTAALGLLSALTVHTAYAQKYSVIFLGTFGGDQTVATGINDLDEVVGYSQLPGNTGAQNAFLYKNGKLIDLDPNPKDFASWATGINHYGQIAGYASNSQTIYAFLYQHGTLTNLGSLSGPTGVSLAFGINDSGEIVGTTTIANGNYVPFLYRNGIMTQLGMTSGGLAEALAINNLGQIVGIGITQSGAFLYQNGSFIDLGTLGGTGGSFASQALAINNLGDVVGLSHLPSGQQHPFLYKNAVMTDLGGGQGGFGFGINDAGEIVGETEDNNGVPFAFLYTTKNGMLNLNNLIVNIGHGTSSGFTAVYSARAINKNGNIVGVGNYFNGTKTIQAGFLLKRISK